MIVSVLIDLNSAYPFLKTQLGRELLPVEVLSSHDTDLYGISKRVKFDLSMLGKELLAEIDVELGVSLVRNVDLICGRTFSWLVLFPLSLVSL